jgi:hypothetical protein
MGSLDTVVIQCRMWGVEVGLRDEGDPKPICHRNRLNRIYFGEDE